MEPVKIYRVWRRIAAWLTVFLLMCCFGTTAFAYEAIDTGREAALTVYFGKDGSGFPGVEFRAYRVADVSADTQFTLSGDFAEYPVVVNGLDSSGWRALAQTLDGYVARDELTPLQTAKTGADGKAFFDHLDTGLYLVTGDRYRQGRYIYTPEPFLIALPTLDDADAWVYDVTSSCKYDCNYNPPGSGDDTIDREVLKVWEDDGHKDKRPDEIIVQLLRDGKVYDTVTLNEQNNWNYTWSDLDDDYQWRVVEYKTPEGYTVSVNRQGITFVMTNTWEGPPDTPPETPPPETPPETPPDEPDEPTPPDTPDEPGLPQTGALWWPVPLLACSGVLMFLIGWARRRHERQ